MAPGKSVDLQTRVFRLEQRLNSLSLPSSQQINMTAAGRALLLAADASAQRALLGLGTVAVEDAGDTIVVTFYSAATSGGVADVLNTVTFASGILLSWTQGTLGSPGEWLFNDPVNSGQVLTIGF